jgi:succinoglycan biosynthesis transport protein ExoP
MNAIGPVTAHRPVSFENADLKRYELKELLGVLKRRRASIFIWMLCFVLLATMYVLFSTKMYTAQTTVLIDPRRLQIFRQDSVTTDPTFDSPTVESQLEMLRSEQVVLAVVRNLRLHQDDEFIGPSGNPIGNAIRFVRSFFGSDPVTEEALIRRTVAIFKNRMDARRVGLSYAITITFTSQSPNKAAAIANEIAEAFMLDQLESKFQLTQRAGTWLQGRIRELQIQASEAERNVLAFKSENQIVDANGRLVNEQQMTEMSTQLSVARSQTAEARARLDRIRDVVRGGIPDASITDALRNEVLIRLRQDYLDVTRREQDWASRFGPNHGATIQLRADRNRLEQSMIAELKRMSENYASDFEIAKSKEDAALRELNELMSKWSETRQAQVKLKELESTASSFRALHDTFVQRYLLAVQQQSFPISDARVITQATPPSEPSAPRVFLLVFGALIVGFGFGTAVALTREFLDVRVRTGAHVTSITGGEFLGVIPNDGRVLRHSIEHYATLLDRAVAPGESSRTFSILKARPELWISVRQPFSLMAETIRNAAVAVDGVRMLRKVRTIAVISANQSEGKTNTSCNLALSLARSGNKVLLIDGDLRKPNMTRMICPDAELGLLDVLAGRKALNDVIWREEITGLAFVPTVLVQKPKDTARLMSSEPMQRLLAQAGETFDYVILDTAPVAQVVDVRAASHMIDAFVLAVSWGETSRTDLERIKSYDFLQNKLVGSVLTKVSMRHYRQFEPYSDSYYGDHVELETR